MTQATITDARAVLKFAMRDALIGFLEESLRQFDFIPGGAVRLDTKRFWCALQIGRLYPGTYREAVLPAVRGQAHD